MKKNRLEMIIQYMTEHNNTASVSELCDTFHVSDMTIRRDLQSLEKSNQIIRHHGGASLINIANSPFSADSLNMRLNTNYDLKTSLGKVGANYLKEILATSSCSSIFLASGSTLYCMANQINFSLRQTTLVTDNLSISQIFAPNPNYTVIMIGGQLTLPSLNSVGHLAEKMIKNFTYDYAFIGAATIDSEGYVYTYNFIEAGTFLSILDSAKKIVVIADSTKICKKTFVQLFKLKKGHTLITNSDIPESFKNTLTSNGVKIITD